MLSPLIEKYMVKHICTLFEKYTIIYIIYEMEFPILSFLTCLPLNCPSISYINYIKSINIRLLFNFVLVHHVHGCFTSMCVTKLNDDFVIDSFRVT